MIEVSVFFWDEYNLPVGERYFDLHVKTGLASGGVHNFQRGIGAVKTIETAAVEQLGRFANTMDKDVYWMVDDDNINTLKEITDYTKEISTEIHQKVLNKKMMERERWLAVYGPDGYFKNNYSSDGENPRIKIPKKSSLIEESSRLEITTGETLEDARIETADNSNIPTKDQISKKLELILEAINTAKPPKHAT